jgi:hypothetical protein
LQQEIGLGAATSIPRVAIRWPVAGTPPQVITNVPVDCVVEIQEGTAEFRVTRPSRFKLGGPASKP